MTRQQSEGEVHVEAMRLILAEMERREDVPDWTIWQHMLNMLETIFQGIVDQRADDADEIETLRKELADAQRAVSDAFAEVNSVRQQLAAANAAVTLQRAGIERLQAFVNLSRRFLGDTVRYANVDRLRAGLAELDAGTEPTPVAEPFDAEGGA